MNRYFQILSENQNNKNGKSDQMNIKKQLNLDGENIDISKYIVEEKITKDPLQRVSNNIVYCGKHHEEHQDFSQENKIKWLQNIFKKRIQETVLSNAIYQKREHDKEEQDWVDKELGGDLISTVRENMNNKNIIEPTKNKQFNGATLNLKQEKVLWKKKMINELHSVNRFMNEFNALSRQERAQQKKQKLIGDLNFDDQDQKKQEHQSQLKERNNQLYKRMYGLESLERVQAKGIFKELLQDLINDQIKIGIQEKDQIIVSLNDLNFKKDDKKNNNKLANSKSNVTQNKQKSESMHQTRKSIVSMYDKKEYGPESFKARDLNTLVMINKINGQQNNVVKKPEKTRSEIQFGSIAQITKMMNKSIIKDYNRLHVQTFIENKQIRDEQATQILSENKERLELIEQEYIKTKTAEGSFMQDDIRQHILTTDDILTNRSSDEIFQYLIQNKLNQNSKQHEIRSKSNIQVKCDTDRNSYSTNTNQNWNNYVKTEGGVTDRSYSQRQSIQLTGEVELGLDYFKYLKRKNENKDEKQVLEIKEKLKDNPLCQKIITLKNIEKISKIQDFYDNYLNHIQQKIFKKSKGKKRNHHHGYRSLSVLPNMQRKAEFEEEEKLRIIEEEEVRRRQEEEKKNQKKVRTFLQIQSQNDLNKVNSPKFNAFQTQESQSNNQGGTPNRFNKTSIKEQHFQTVYEQNILKQNNNRKQSQQLQPTQSILRNKKLRFLSPQNINSVNQSKPILSQTTKLNNSKTIINNHDIQSSRNHQEQHQFVKQTPNNNILKKIQQQSLQTCLNKDQIQKVIEQKQSQSSTNQNSPQLNKYKINNIPQKNQIIEKQIYSTPLKENNFEQTNTQEREQITTLGTTIDSSDIKNKIKNSQFSSVISNRRKSESISQRSSLHNQNIYIPNLSFFDKMNIKEYTSNIIGKINEAPKDNSNTRLFERIMNINKQCQKESVGVNKIAKNLLLKQRRNWKTFTKLDDMIYKMS